MCVYVYVYMYVLMYVYECCLIEGGGDGGGDVSQGVVFVGFLLGFFLSCYPTFGFIHK